MSRRLRTIICGAIPVVVLGALVGMDHIPGTNISLTVPYAAEGPGPSFNTLGEIEGKEVVEIDGENTDPTSGNLNMTTVSVRTGMTVPQVVSRWAQGDSIVPLDTIFQPGESQEDVQERNKAAFANSETAATLAAMNYLHRKVEVQVVEVKPDSAAEGQLVSGDRIISINGTPVATPAEAQEQVSHYQPGEKITLDIKHQDQSRATLTLNLGENPDSPGKPLLGITMVSVPADGVRIHYNLNEVGGPSAGMMFSLAVVDKLSPGLLNGGKFVAGTGTISADGSVGPIGGITHKMKAAEDLGAELFLAPKDNCAEAMSQDHGTMVVAEVTSLSDAIQQMKAYSEGGDVRTCQSR
ncbi:PDZ domain-containing protein [Corynebacterium poyangense]|uniref:endopeptidase La n=1 Tax=Corynebacterium poyangense TaxID=2684405 RepID=A0A7H0SMM9_9CORY|nr:PDZ domain-containing protein [Corynebacterium poyangense]MBZ8176910.1 PDZ domain-containing protein [Corynebacterium poyangense]QNQ89804.1 PDZ domain-containing protein [Corynebacterium poyangense]